MGRAPNVGCLPLEFERKFIVPDAPAWLAQHPAERIEQGYLAIEDERTEVRLRRLGDRMYLTVKRGSPPAREEVELEVSEDQFEALWPLTAGRRLAKTRHQVPSETGELVVDVYGGALEGLIVAEVELAVDERSDRFEVPPWCGPEVTGDPRYQNRNLATIGAPAGAPPVQGETRADLDAGQVPTGVLEELIERADAEPGRGPGRPSVRDDLRGQGNALDAALDDAAQAPGPEGIARLRERCADYAASALAGARSLFAEPELMGQVRPSDDQVLRLIAEQDLDRGWMRSEDPISTWRGIFLANHDEITEGARTAALFDRLMVATGLAVQLLDWLAESGLGAGEGRPGSRPASARVER